MASGFHRGPGQYNHKPPSEKVVGEGVGPAAKVPTNILVRPLRSPPMERIKDAEDPPLEEEA